MAKKATKANQAPAPLKEVQPENEAQAELVDLLRAFDDFGVSIVEEQWRAFSDSERNLAIAWASAKRRGVNSIVPACLLPFATEEIRAQHDGYLAEQAAIRNVIYPCTFGKPSPDKSEEGDIVVCMKIKIPDSHLTGSKARELFGKTRANVEFSRRPVGEWDQGELMSDGPRRIVSCVAEIPSFGWADGKFSFGFRIEGTVLPFLDAVDLWKNQGSIRLEILGEAIEEDSAPAASSEPKKRGRPKKAEPEAAPPSKPLPGTTEAELADSFSVAFTEKYLVSLSIKQLDSERFESVWSGTGPAGETQEPEPSIRSSVNQAAVGSIGKAIDYWRSYTDPESEAVLISLRHWLKELEAGKSPALIESEAA